MRHPVTQPSTARSEIARPASDFHFARPPLGAQSHPLSYGESFGAATHIIDGAREQLASLTPDGSRVAKYWHSPSIRTRPGTPHVQAQVRLFLGGRPESSGRRRRSPCHTCSELWARAEANPATVIAAGVQVNEVDRVAFHRAAEPLLAAELRDSELNALYQGIRAAA